MIAFPGRTALTIFGLLVGGYLFAQEPVTEDPIVGLVARAAPIDVDGDGHAEVRSLRLFGGAGEAASPRVLVLVEARLLTARENVRAADRDRFRERLHRHAKDLADAGYRADILALEVYSGPRHQDGRTVLGMRSLLKACAVEVNLVGAVLVGHFPDAQLVRTCNWRKKEKVELPDRGGKTVSFAAGTHWLRRVPEIVAHRFDLVLADLDGNWEQRYIGEPTALEHVEAVFVDTAHIETGGLCAGLRVTQATHTDVFHIADGAVSIDPHGFTVAIDDTVRDLECTTQDLWPGNSIALPDIAISRVDARGAAWSPKPKYLSDDGRPKRVAFPTSKVPRWDHIWQPDPELELRLLCEYFDRNHRYRTEGVRDTAHKPASIAWGLGSGMRSLRRASARWEKFNEGGYDVRKEVDLLKLVAWLRRPALLRSLRTHSNGLHAMFAKTNVRALEQAIGGVPWSFSRHGNALVPSLDSACRAGRADFFLYRTLWANTALPTDPYFLVHTGCEALSPPNHTRAFDHPSYGARQHAESILFYTPCLAIIGRAKVFYDEPRGFSETLRDGGTFGDAWRRYFLVEGAVKSWDKAGGDIGRKRSYFWSVLGDWTLRMPAMR